MQNVLTREALFEIIEGIKKSDDLPAELPLRMKFGFDLAFPSGMPIRLYAYATGTESDKMHVVHCRSGPYKSCSVQSESFDEAINKALLNLLAKKYFNIQEES
ncbi:MAG: hypothetical protein J5852_08900 [Clostridia bacterium]|nr:hypothetical protein [Clostridia bacterium]